MANNGFDYAIDQTTYYSILRDSGYHVANAAPDEAYCDSGWQTMDSN